MRRKCTVDVNLVIARTGVCWCRQHPPPHTPSGSPTIRRGACKVRKVVVCQRQTHTNAVRWCVHGTTKQHNSAVQLMLKRLPMRCATLRHGFKCARARV